MTPNPALDLQHLNAANASAASNKIRPEFEVNGPGARDKFEVDTDGNP